MLSGADRHQIEFLGYVLFAFAGSYKSPLGAKPTKGHAQPCKDARGIQIVPDAKSIWSNVDGRVSETIKLMPIGSATRISTSC
jgi:hypothetical protein